MRWRRRRFQRLRRAARADGALSVAKGAALIVSGGSAPLPDEATRYFEDVHPETPPPRDPKRKTPSGPPTTPRTAVYKGPRSRASRGLSR